MLQVGDEVVVMSAPGYFTVVAIEGPLVTIESENGIRKQVNITAVRKRPAKVA